MANSKRKIWLTEIIGDDYKYWNKEYVIFDAGTGCGKTTFTLNVLARYAENMDRRILYLCNRSGLKSQIYEAAQNLSLKNIFVSSYQSLQNKIRKGKSIDHYDYIIADECHYFTTDALFNDYTDLSYDFIMNQSDSVVILMSATAKSFFQWLTDKCHMPIKNVYRVENEYDYVSNLYFYDKKILTTIINKILKEETDSKAVVFCNSANRMLELHGIYGDSANYYCARHSRNRKLQEICEPDCIVKLDDGRCTYEKRILFATKALDNGVDLKDYRIKHIFSELFDIDSMVQALGRKRVVHEYDFCNFYLKEYTTQAIQGMLNQNNHQLEPVYLYKNNYASFYDKYGNGFNRKDLKNNDIFYSHFQNEEDKLGNAGKIKINEMKYNKYLRDNNIMAQMKKWGYIPIVCQVVGEVLSGKIEPLEIEPVEKDPFFEYLQNIEGIRLYQDDREQIKTEFEKIGAKLRYLGINTFNGALDDKYSNYSCRFQNKDSHTGKYLVDTRTKLDDGRDNPYWKKQYWLLK